MIRIKQFAVVLLLTSLVAGKSLEAKLDGQKIVNQAEKALQSQEVNMAMYKGIQFIIAAFFNEITRDMSEEDRKAFFELVSLMVELNGLKLAREQVKDKSELAKIEQAMKEKNGILSVKILPLAPHLEQWKQTLEHLIKTITGMSFIFSGHPNVMNS